MSAESDAWNVGKPFATMPTGNAIRHARAIATIALGKPSFMALPPLETIGSKKVSILLKHIWVLN
jgi:hypothetical protein